MVRRKTQLQRWAVNVLCRTLAPLRSIGRVPNLFAIVCISQALSYPLLGLSTVVRLNGHNLQPASQSYQPHHNSTVGLLLRLQPV